MSPNIDNDDRQSTDPNEVHDEKLGKVGRPGNFAVKNRALASAKS
jgi:hypothetical protein